MGQTQPKKKIVVIGSEGIVGRAYVRFFNLRKDIFDVTEFDIIDPIARDAIKGKHGYNDNDLAVICVPTPQGKDGVIMTHIHEVFKWLKVPLVLIKSTIPPTEAEKLQTNYGRVVFSPEFCGESKYYIPDELMHKDDIVKHPYYILGGNEKDTSAIIDYLVPVAGPTKMYFQTDIKTASLVKYFENVFFATKVTFCQEMYEVCKAFGVDYHEVRELWLADPRINRMHTSIFKDERGYSGKCLPKEVDGLIKETRKVGYECELLKQVQKSNETFKGNK
jgi:UDPglucose 6-dehydrogenase